MKKIIFALPLFCLLTVPVSAAPPYPLDELLVRAKFVYIAEVSTFDGTNVSLKVQSELRGDLGTNSQSFKVDTAWGKPEKGKRYFVFSQGHDRWGQPKNEIKLSQGIDCQGSYCGWLMLPIQKEKDVDIVKNAYSFKFRKPEEGIGPLTLEQAKQLVEQTKFKGNHEKAKVPNEPLLPDGVNQILGRIRPNMSESQLEKVVKTYYPNAESTDGPWSGQTGYVQFKVTPRYSISVAEYNDPKDLKLRFVHADMILNLYDWKLKRRINISFHKWDDQTKKDGGKASQQKNPPAQVDSKE